MTTVFLSQVNHARFRGQQQGFYESYFMRANHPERPIAFWIRYTLFSPQGTPDQTVGELWAVVFNGDTHQHLAVKQEFSLMECIFDPSSFRVKIGEAQLNAHTLLGEVRTQKHIVTWDLTYSSNSEPLLLLPIRLYTTIFPAAKSLVGMPLATFSGKISVDGNNIPVLGWLGSQNHNWGRRHTDRYAWGQVSGFDDYPDTFLEVAAAQLRLGNFWTPPFTPLVLRHKGREYAMNGLLQSLSARGELDYFTWNFRSRTAQMDLQGTISAPRDAFVGLSYNNPPGGVKHCLNTKIASCRVEINDKIHGVVETLDTKHRAAFEILTDDRSHGIHISA